jgi:phosphatidylserine decarboxylase
VRELPVIATIHSFSGRSHQNHVVREVLIILDRSLATFRRFEGKYPPFHKLLSPSKMAHMKHKGKALQAALRLIFYSLLILLALAVLGILAALLGSFIAMTSSLLFGLWVLFSLFCLWFFRDPSPQIPSAANAIVSPAHGKVDVIDEINEPEFIGGACRRISIFLSVIEVHVQNAPITGKIAHLKQTAGQFMSALRQESAAHNENVLIGLDSSEKPGEKIAVRRIAGVLARRINPWIALGDEVARGERISLIQFGSRVDIYLPLEAQICVKLGDKLKGGESIVAIRA